MLCGSIPFTAASTLANAATIERKWYVVDATDLTLGRLASEVASVLRGKNKPTYTPHVDTGDYVIIVNADKVVMTGKKLDTVNYYHHSGWLLHNLMSIFFLQINHLYIRRFYN